MMTKACMIGLVQLVQESQLIKVMETLSGIGVEKKVGDFLPVDFQNIMLLVKLTKYGI